MGERLEKGGRKVGERLYNSNRVQFIFAFCTVPYFHICNDKGLRAYSMLYSSKAEYR